MEMQQISHIVGHCGLAQQTRIVKATAGMKIVVRKPTSQSSYMAWKLLINESIP